MVVLSVGMVIPPDIGGTWPSAPGHPAQPQQLRGGLLFEPTSTFQEGIFSCGAFNGPKDIPQSVIEGSTTAATATRNLAAARGTMLKEKVSSAGKGPDR